jgi:5-methylcytosine-specific restriction endonuclease McrA
MENVPKKINLKTTGKNNYQWKGGIADYKNHYQMKLNRLEKLEQTKGKCEICDEDATQIHHRDGGRYNHAISNLVVLCKKHHAMVDMTNTTFKTSKYIRKYGMSIREMTEKLGEYSIPQMQKILQDSSKRKVILKKLAIKEKP